MSTYKQNTQDSINRRVDAAMNLHCVRHPIRRIEELDAALDRDSQVALALRAVIKEQEARQ